MQDLHFRKITIVGVGLLGGSIGLAMRAAGFTGGIIGVGRHERSLDDAVRAGCINRGTTDLREGVAGSDLIVLAAPIGAINRLLERLGEIDSGGAIITDVGSTKRTIVQTAERALAEPGRFVGSHPMAGGERPGPEAARADLFHNRPVVLTPTGRTRPETTATVERLWRALGMRIHRMSPERHDRAVARISHLPHAVAVLLVAMNGGDGELDLASTGFGDTTRIAGGDPALWTEIFLDNREAVLRALDDWDAIGSRFRELVAGEKHHELMELLRSAQSTRERWLASAQQHGHPRRRSTD